MFARSLAWAPPRAHLPERPPVRCKRLLNYDQDRSHEDGAHGAGVGSARRRHAARHRRCSACACLTVYERAAW